ncbi:hypothetical protein EDD21DRAFT_402236, partial [Dissophora ornata]
MSTQVYRQGMGQPVYRDSKVQQYHHFAEHDDHYQPQYQGNRYGGKGQATAWERAHVYSDVPLHTIQEEQEWAANPLNSLTDTELTHGNQQEQPISDSSTESMDTLHNVDLNGELEKIKQRLQILAGDAQTSSVSEKAALLELEQSTEALILSRRMMNERQHQLILLHITDSKRPNLQAELAQLSENRKLMAEQWSTDMDAYYREFVVAAAAAAVEAAAKANAELRAKLEHDIRILNGQIANLQRQMDAVAARRRRMQ